MKNGTRSSHGLTLVDSSDEQTSSKMQAEGAYEPATTPSDEGGDGPMQDLLQNKSLFAIVSIACFTAAVAAGSYAIWLSRRKAATEALTHVSDLLETCQSRMSQMENDLKSLSVSA